MENLVDQMSVIFKELLTSLSKAQSEYPDIPKSRTGQEGHRKFKYADLNDIHKAIKPVNAKHGLSISHMTSDTHVVSRLYHNSGASLTTALPLKFTENPKHTGATLTYLKRYNIQSLLDISTEEDLDAINASEDKDGEKGSKQLGNGTKPDPQTNTYNAQKSAIGKIAVGPKAGKTFDEVLKLDSVDNFRMAKAIAEAISQGKQCDPSYVAYMNYAMSEGVEL